MSAALFLAARDQGRNRVAVHGPERTLGTYTARTTGVVREHAVFIMAAPVRRRWKPGLRVGRQVVLRLYLLADVTGGRRVHGGLVRLERVHGIRGKNDRSIH